MCQHVADGVCFGYLKLFEKTKVNRNDLCFSLLNFKSKQFVLKQINIPEFFAIQHIRENQTERKHA